MDILLILLGSIGATLSLAAFMLNQIDRLTNDSIVYDLMNAFAGLLLFIYALILGAIPFMIINAVWGIVSFRDVLLKDRPSRRNSKK